MKAKRGTPSRNKATSGGTRGRAVAASGTVSRRRRWLSWGALLALAGLLLLWWRSGGAALLPEPAWDVTVSSNPSEGTPWSPFLLEARKRGSGAAAAANLGLHWRWEVDGADLAADHAEGATPDHEAGSVRKWQSGALGSHRVSVIATSGRGTEKRAEIDLLIREVPDKNKFAREPPPEPAVLDVPFAFGDVSVEPAEVCVGEPAAVRSTATAKDGRPGRLVTTIDGALGSSGTFISLGGEPGMRRIALQLRDPELPGKYAATEVYVELKDCFAPATMIVENAPDPSIVDRYAFRAKLVHLSETTAVVLPAATTYSWDFADGQKEVSDRPDFSHTFPSEAQRPADELAHSYFVKVEARDDANKVLAKGFTTVYIGNLHRQSKEHGSLELLVHYRDSPVTTTNGDLSFPVTLENIDTVESAHLTKAVLRSIPCAATESSVEETTESIASIFSSSVVGPRETISGALLVSGASERKICRVVVELVGQSAPGSLRVGAGFSVTVGSGEGFRKEIDDPKKLEALKTVSRLLGKAAFTDEDIRKLEDEGKIPRGVLIPDPLPATPDMTP